MGTIFRYKNGSTEPNPENFISARSTHQPQLARFSWVKKSSHNDNNFKIHYWHPRYASALLINFHSYLISNRCLFFISRRFKTQQIPANCSTCDIEFSNRANARRHERNIDGVIMNPLANVNSIATSCNSSLFNGAVNLSMSASTPKATLRLMSLIKKRLLAPPSAKPLENWDCDNLQKHRSYLTPAKLSLTLQN